MTPISGSIEEVGSLAKMMYEYGPVVVIISVFLMLFIVILFYMMRQQQQSHFLSREKFPFTPPIPPVWLIVKEHLRISNIIRIHTSTYIVLLKASRIALYALHNGNSSVSGLPFLKFSCVSEYVMNAIDSRIRQQTNFPINFMSDLLEDLCEKVEVHYYDEKDLARSANKTLVDMILSRSENKYIFRGIFDSSSNLIAFIVCEFDLENINPDNYKEKSIFIDELIARIAPILEYSNFNDIYTKKVQINETKGVWIRVDEDSRCCNT